MKNCLLLALSLVMLNTIANAAETTLRTDKSLKEVNAVLGECVTTHVVNRMSEAFFSAQSVQVTSHIPGHQFWDFTRVTEYRGVFGQKKHRTEKVGSAILSTTESYLARLGFEFGDISKAEFYMGTTFNVSMPRIWYFHNRILLGYDKLGQEISKNEPYIVIYPDSATGAVRNSSTGHVLDIKLNVDQFVNCIVDKFTVTKETI